jgi:hypothetical protein
MNTPNLVCPDTEHAPEWDEDRSNVCDGELRHNNQDISLA